MERLPRRWLIAAVVLGASVMLNACTPPPPLWTETEVALLRSMSLASLPPALPSPSNRYADDPAAMRFGKTLFDDTRLSRDGDQSCASCHQAQRHFTDGLARGQGVSELTRNTPSLVASAWQTWFYWDGRRDSLWSQALVPIEAPAEMAGSRTAVVRLVATDPIYRETYLAVFGPFPPSLQIDSLPAHAGYFTDAAGKAAWASLDQTQRRAVNQVYANLGKAIAAFERTLVPQRAPFDRYVDTLVREGEAAAAALGLVSDAQVAGAKLFVDARKSNCLQCHNGPLLTNGGFHNVGTGGMNGPVPDMGRFLGVQSVLLDEFNCQGDYSDAKARDCSALRFLARDDHGDMVGAFKVPSLRNVAQTAPYFHDGRFASLREVLVHYNQPPAAQHELQPLNFTAQELADIEAFLLLFESPAT